MLPELPYGLPPLLTWQPSLVVSHGSSSKGSRACRLRLQLASPSFLFIIWIHLKRPWKHASISAQKSYQRSARFCRQQVAPAMVRRRRENGNQGPNSGPPDVTELHSRPQRKGTEQILITIIYIKAIIFPVTIKKEQSEGKYFFPCWRSIDTCLLMSFMLCHGFN